MMSSKDNSESHEKVFLHIVDPDFVAMTLLAGMVFIMFADLLLLPTGAIVSHALGDTSMNHVYLRAFGFDELRHGNIALWNPYIFSGTPYLGSFQSALLYPLNITYLFLPITKAINFDIALHIFLLGFFTYKWMRVRQLHPLAAFYTAGALMFCAAIFLRVLAGQINVVTTLAWVPLLFLCVDKIFDNAGRTRFPSGWCLAAIATTTMMVYAGYPQSLFMTAVCVALYCAIRLPRATHKPQAIAELLLVGALPVFMSAIQLWTSAQAGMESVRGGDVTYEFGSSFSFPPENLITFLAPAFFGDITHIATWGRWGFWDVSLYMGVVTFFLAIFGAIADKRPFARIAIIIFAVTLLIGMGRYTPLHQFLFEWVPGFDKFRAPSKILFFTSLFGTILAGCGIDRMIASTKGTRTLAYAALGVGTTMAAGAALIYYTSRSLTEESPWWKFVSEMKSTQDTFIWFAITKEFVAGSARLAQSNLLTGGAVAIILGLLLWRLPAKPRIIYLITLLGIAEVFIFALRYRETFNIAETRRPSIEQFYTSRPGDYRILDVVDFDNKISNHAVGMRVPGIWGYDPLMLKRYAEYMSTAASGRRHADVIAEHIFTWGTEPIGLSTRLNLVRFTEEGIMRDGFQSDVAMLRLLRCAAIFRPEQSDKYDSLLTYIHLKEDAADSDKDVRAQSIYLVPDVLPRFMLFQNYQVLEDPEAILDALDAYQFNPVERVILESEPNPKPTGALTRAKHEVLDESTDHVTMHVQLDAPAILMVTDAYAAGWRVKALEGSVQQDYDLLPADYTLRAIPLEAGDHHFRMEYMPSGYEYGRWATLISMIVFALMVAAWALRYRKSRAPTPVND